MLITKGDITDVEEAVISYGKLWPMEAWGRIKKLVEEKFTSTNTGSPKLPTHDEMFEATGAEDRHRWVTQQFYDELCRQLRAGA